MESEKQVLSIADALAKLTPSQLAMVQSVINQLALPYEFKRNEKSDLITAGVLDSLGDSLRAHHTASKQPLTKDKFEHALQHALSANGFQAALATSRTNRGHDITVDGVRISLKTEAASNIREHYLHISKFMELGRGAWELPLLLEHYLTHLQGYERVFQFRCLGQGPRHYFYELVEIPKRLLEEAKDAVLEVRGDSRQNPQPGYGSVYAADGSLKYQLYFDGGSERKLQIKGLRKDLCMIHATWAFESASP